jgi:hypothetical protein
MAENPLIGRRGLSHLGAVLAWAPLGLTLALAAGALAFGLLDNHWDHLFLVPAIAFAAVGATIATKRSGNAIGWLFCAVGVMLAGGVFSNAYGYHALIAEPGSLPGGAYAASITPAIMNVPLYAGVLLLLLFPTGKLPSRRWRPVVWLQAVGFVAGCATILEPGPLDDAPFAQIHNPLGIEGTGGVFGRVGVWGWLVLILSYVVVATALAMRYRRAVGAERQQLKWMASAGVFFALAILAIDLTSDAPKAVADAAYGMAIAAFTAIPIAAGLAIFRYRLYEIDVIIRRTLVYGVVTAGLAGLYFAIVLALQQIFSSFAGGSDLAIAGSTLAVAALFRPARNRIQALVDRRFYRRRYDTQRTLETFNARLREELDLGTLRRELLQVVDETMRPAGVSLWLRSGR